MLTTREAAEQLGVSCDHVRLMIAKGKIPAVNISVGSKSPRWRIVSLDQAQVLPRRPSISKKIRQIRNRIVENH